MARHFRSAHEENGMKRSILARTLVGSARAVAGSTSPHALPTVSEPRDDVT